MNIIISDLRLPKADRAKNALKIRLVEKFLALSAAFFVQERKLA